MNPNELPVHPVWGQALDVMPSGRVVWPIQGGAEDGDADADDTTKDDDADAGTGASDDASVTDDDATKDNTDDASKGTEKVTEGPDWKARSRQNEAGKKAAERKLNSVLTALGLNKDGDLTAEQLKEKFEAAGEENKGLKVENAVIKHAAKAGVDADELTDSKSFMGKVADLDPEDKDFAKDVQALITAEVKRRPSLKAGSGAGTGGSKGSSSKETTGDNGKGQLTKADLAKMSAAQIVKAQNEGRLDVLMGKKS